MPELIDTLAQVQDLLRANQIQAAADLLGTEIATQREAAVAAGLMPPETKPPREPITVITDILTEVVGLLGNKETLLNLLFELHVVS